MHFKACATDQPAGLGCFSLVWRRYGRHLPRQIMKYNIYNAWTVALVSAGVVSLPAAARAEETATTNSVLTALSTTTISGYVDTSAQWNPGTGNANLPV